MSALRLWGRIWAYALRLTLRALARKWPWLLVAPAVSTLVALLAGPVSMLGVAGGFVLGIVYAAGLSLVLYVARGIIEQRRMDADDLTHGLGAFLGEVMNVLFVVWLVSLVARLAPPLFLVAGAALAALPVFETVALTAAGGFGAFGSAWSFFKRDAGPWLLGQWAAALLMAAGLLLADAAGDLVTRLPLPDLALRPLALLAQGIAPAAGLAAFVYRGVLFLALDSVSPHARARKFGDA